MLVACTSDIHTDISENNMKSVELLAEILRNLDPDVFVFAGDVSSEDRYIEHFMKELSTFKKPKFFVCGNHDIWVSPERQSQGYNSFTKYYHEMKEKCQRYGFLYLAKNPVTISEVAFVGTIGWYDYSTRNPALDRIFTLADYESKESLYGIWNDREYAFWPRAQEASRRGAKTGRTPDRMSDQEVASMFCSDLRSQLRSVENKVKKTIAVTHVVPFKYMVRFTGNAEFDFFSAFIGNTQLGEDMKASKHVTHAICGHTHFPAQVEFDSVKCVCSPIGYLDKFKGDIYDYILSRVKTFEV